MIRESNRYWFDAQRHRHFWLKSIASLFASIAQVSQGRKDDSFCGRIQGRIRIQPPARKTSLTIVCPRGKPSKSVGDREQLCGAGPLVVMHERWTQMQILAVHRLERHKLFEDCPSVDGPPAYASIHPPSHPHKRPPVACLTCKWDPLDWACTFDAILRWLSFSAL